MVTKLDETNFEKETKDLSIVDFYADWCGPCKRMAPVLEEVEAEYKDRINFCKVDTENNPELASRFQIMGIPCLIIFKNNEEVDRIVGLMSADDLKSKVEEVVSKNK